MALPSRTAPFADRFWARVDRSGGEDACWPWQRHRLPKGYGTFTSRDGVGSALAHRIAYELARGPIPDGLMVMHACDHPPCCNPRHLSLGTASDNMRDASSKGRVRGTFPRKYSAQMIADIRVRRARGETIDGIARAVGGSRSAVSRICAAEASA